MYGFHHAPYWKIKSVTRKGESAPIVFHDELNGNKSISEVIKYMLECKTQDRAIESMKIEKRSN